MPAHLNSLLRDAGIDPSDVRLLRHAPSKFNGRTPYGIWRDDPAEFTRFQSRQKDGPHQRAIMGGPIWASFVVTPEGETLFVGLYQVAAPISIFVGSADPLTGRPHQPEEPGDWYSSRRMDELSEYIGRLRIWWGDGTRAWVQRADKQNKVIIDL